MSHTSKKTIVIVGGGSGGVALARSLSSSLDAERYSLILVDSRPYSIWLVAAARVSISDVDDLERRAFLSFDKFFSKGTGSFVQGTVTAVEKSAGAPGGRVLLDDGGRIDWDVLVLAPGAQWEGPVAFGNDPAKISEFIQENRASVRNAESVLIVGGGSVGIGMSPPATHLSTPHTAPRAGR